MEGVEIPDANGADAPTLTTHQAPIRDFMYTAGKKLDIKFHLPHGWVPNNVSYVHVHWSHNGTAISDNAVFTVASSYAKGHNQANFSAPKTQTITYATTNIATTPQYRHRIDEIQLSDATGSGNYLNAADMEVDGIVLMNLTMTTLPTITGGAAGIFIHRVDIHYRSNNLPTKNKAPNFWT